MTNPNDTAYPDNRQHSETHGLTKREHFAATVLNGMLAEYRTTVSLTTLTKEAVWAADCLIAALNQEAL